MRLQQKSFPFGSVVFELSDNSLHIESKRLLSSRSSEVPFHQIATNTSRIRQFPLLWCVLAIVSSFAFLASLIGVLPKSGDAVLGLGALALCCGVFSALTWFGFFERKLDLVILHSNATGQPIVYLKRENPSARHVEEFVQMVMEHVKGSGS